MVMKSLNLLMILASFGVMSDTVGQPAEIETRSIAAQSVMSLRKLINEQNYKAMGFTSPKEVESATLNEPMSVTMVRLDDLRVYQHGDDAGKIVKALDKVIYPVSANGEVRSSITLEKVKGAWKATSFGGPNLTKLLTKARKESSEATHLTLASYFVVELPALNAYFVAHRSENKLMLTAVLNDPTLKLE